MNRLMIVLAPMIAMVAVSVLPQPVAATIITAIGAQTDYGEYWRTTNVAKPAIGGQATDPNGDGAWASDGYYIPTSDSFTNSLPSYISTVAVHGSMGVTGLSYADIDDPRESIGTSVANIKAPSAYGGYVAGEYLLMCNITLAADADFVLTAVTGVSTWVGGYSPGIKLTCGTATATQATGSDGGNAIPDYSFFRITGSKDDVIAVSGLCNSSSFRQFSGLGFESAVPEPGTLTLLATGLVGLLAYAWRKRK